LLFSISVPGEGAVGIGLPAGVTTGIGVGTGLGTGVAIGVGMGVACGEAAACVDMPLNSARAIAAAATAAVMARGIAFME
jgi:hypothetical protein